ncbi:hypothetical protein TNCV_3017171 [Trichonephila clavipes]|nr:hypothetical protein TNCV_3017171 [Trichonephila clavipes]
MKAGAHEVTVVAYGHELVIGQLQVRVLMPIKTRCVVGLMHVKSVEARSSLLWCSALKRGSSLGIVLVTRSMFKNKRSVTNNYRVTL